MTIHSDLLGIRPTKIELALSMPDDPRGIVIFAHGGGSGRTSRRNLLVADSLYRAGFATLLTDLLGQEEQQKDKSAFEYRFNIALLSERLTSVMRWAKDNKATSGLGIGLFGSSTGSAAALAATSTMSSAGIRAIVSRGGRPDLVASELLQAIEIPTLFLVGGEDKSVISWTNDALKLLEKMKERKMIVIPGAGHLFEEPGSLERVSELAVDWFKRFLVP